MQAWLQGLSPSRVCSKLGPPGLACGIPGCTQGWAWERRDGRDSVSLSDGSSGQCRLLWSSFQLDTPGLAGADLNLPSLHHLSSLSPKVFPTTPAEPGVCQQGLPTLRCPTLDTQMHPDRRMPAMQPPRHSRWQASGSQHLAHPHPQSPVLAVLALGSVPCLSSSSSILPVLRNPGRIPGQN